MLDTAEFRFESSVAQSAFALAAKRASFLRAPAGFALVMTCGNGALEWQ